MNNSPNLSVAMIVVFNEESATLMMYTARVVAIYYGDVSKPLSYCETASHGGYTR